MNIVCHTENEVMIFEIAGTLTAANAEELKATYLRSASQSKAFVFNLSGLQLLDSTGLGAIVFCLRNAKENNARLAVCELQGKPKMVFEITRAQKLFNIYDSCKAAVDALSV